VGRERVGEVKVEKVLCSSKNSFKKPWSWTLANFETDRRPYMREKKWSKTVVSAF